MTRYLLVQLHVGEDRVHPPRLAKHGPEAERESRHQDPRSSRADVRKGLFAGQVRVESEEDDRHVGQDAADDDQIVHVGRRHLDLSG